jgi:hypothetical protein
MKQHPLLGIDQQAKQGITTEQEYKIALEKLNFLKNFVRNEQIKFEKLAKELAELKEQYKELENEFRTPIPDWIPVYEDGKIINL